MNTTETLLDINKEQTEALKKVGKDIDSMEKDLAEETQVPAPKKQEISEKLSMSKGVIQDSYEMSKAKIEALKQYGIEEETDNQ